jgi:hypothetical protein
MALSSAISPATANHRTEKKMGASPISAPNGLCSSQYAYAGGTINLWSNSSDPILHG